MDEYIITFTKKELEEIEGAMSCYINDRCCGGDDEEIPERIIYKVNKKLESIAKFEKQK
jgi:hypothetical protein